MREFEQIESVMKTIQNIVEAMKNGKIKLEIVAEDIKAAVKEVNRILYYSEDLKFQKECCLENQEEYIGELEDLIQIWGGTIKRRSTNCVDAEFWSIYEYFKYVDVKIIYQSVVQHFNNLPEATKTEFLSLSNRYTFLQHKLDFTKQDYSLVEQHVLLMSNEIEKYKWLYERLADKRSKVVLNRIIRYWFEFDLGRLYSICESTFCDYWDLDILECSDKEVLVDLGAYIGDSASNFINTYGVYKKIYAYEITPSTYQILQQNLSVYPNVMAINKGIGDRHATMYLDSAVNGADNKLLQNGDKEIEVVTLDEDIEETISIIKMDIEGAEKAALLGAKGHIKTEKPKLLISAYHTPEDIFEIPELISSIRDDYKFYLRFNGHGCLWPCDYVLFAV